MFEVFCFLSLIDLFKRKPFCKFRSMKKIGVIIVALLISFASFAGEGDSKTILVLFKSKELKSLKLSLKDIENQFSAFDTKSYGGNSEPAIIIELPSGDFGDCFLGQFIVQINKNQRLRLEEVAFRMIDLSATQEAKESFLIAYEEDLQKKKNDKSAQ